MKTRKVNTGAHAAQEVHTAEDCRINEAPHNHPDTDCGHRVDDGPGAGIPEYDGKDGTVTAGFAPASADKDQDPNRGPGVK